MQNASSASDAGPVGLFGTVAHVGMSVASLDAALAFWEPFLGRPARWRTVLDRPYLGEIVGIPAVRIEAAFVDLPGGNTLELLDYRDVARNAHGEATPDPGNVHLCLAVSDAEAAWHHAVACGARPVREAGPSSIDGGPNKGAKAAYLRIHDGITLELFQRAKGVTA